MSHSQRSIFLALFFVSGACGLIYEITWSRLLVFVFGGTTLAISTVLSCFMGGLALGSFLAGRLARRIMRPCRVYGLLELAIGACCLVLPFLFDLALPFYRALARVSGESFFWLSLARIAVCGVILIVPTTLMGATLPVLCQAFARRPGELGHAVSRLYGTNTLGAFAGTVGAGFFLLPAIGLYRSVALAAGLNLAAGAIALWLDRSAPSAPPPEPEDLDQAPEVAIEPAPIRPSLLLLLFALSGFAALAYQVAWTRALILSMGASTYAFSSIVASFILGIGLGSLLINLRIGRLRSPLAVAGLLELAIGLSALVVVPLFGRMPLLVEQMSQRTGARFGGILVTEFFSVLGLLIVPTLCMGALLPIVCVIYRSCTRGAGRAARAVGNVYAFNTLGTILGAAAAGFVLIPTEWIGMQRTILLASALSGLIGTVMLLSDRRAGARPALHVILAGCWIAGLALGATIGPWSRAAMLSAPYLGRRHVETGETLFYREGIDMTVAVTSRNDNLVLRVNGKPDASTYRDDLPTQFLTGHLPMLLRPEARHVCVIGLGSGITTGAVLAHPVEWVEVAEISAGVIDAARHFDAYNNGALDDPRLRLYRADGRNHLLLSDRRYDLIISEPSNPWLSGVGNLFTREFLDIARDRLKPGGIHAQWIQAYSMKADDFAAVLSTMADRFRHVQVWQMALADYLILGSDAPFVIDLESFYLARRHPVVAATFGMISLGDPVQLGHHFIADGDDLAEWIRGRPPLADDTPRLEFSAPRYLLRDEEVQIAERLNKAASPPELSGPAGSPLNRMFLETLARARRAKAALRRATVARRSGDPQVVHAYRELAANGFDDGRICLLLDRELTALSRTAGGAAGDRFAELHAELASYVPCVARLREAGPTDTIRLDWPLGPSRPPRAPSSVREMVAEGQRMVDAGRVAEAAALAREAAELAPNDPGALGMAGLWTLAADGADAGTPYLLRLWLLAPDHAETNYHLARAYALRGLDNRSLQFLEAAIEAGFRDKARLESSELPQLLGSTPGFAELISRL